MPARKAIHSASVKMFAGAALSRPVAHRDLPVWQSGYLHTVPVEPTMRAAHPRQILAVELLPLHTPSRTARGSVYRATTFRQGVKNLVQRNNVRSPAPAWTEGS